MVPERVNPVSKETNRQLKGARWTRGVVVFLLPVRWRRLRWLARAVMPVPLTRVGGILWVGYEPLFLARDLGRYDAGTLRLVEMPSNTANLMALATGELEAATLTLDEFLLCA